MRVECTTLPSSPRDWDSFVESRENSTLGHAAAWPVVLQRAYGLSPCCIRAVRTDGSTSGVLALVRFRSLRGERSLISLPYLDASGVLACDKEAEDSLLEAALAETERQAGQALELRQSHRITSGDEAASTHRLNLCLALENDEDAQWKALPAKVRNQTRKAIRDGVTLHEATTEVLLEEFYRVFCVNMRDLGSPVHARRFFAAASETFGKRLRFVVAEREGRPIAGLVAIHYAGKVTVPWASTLRSERSHCPNNLIYWEAIRWATSLGARAFDFGRSPEGSGTYRFKRGWKAEPTPLAWTRFTPAGEILPLHSAGESSLLRRMSRLWTHAPVPLTTLVGPSIRRFLAE